eukprot:m.89575 g.89575  ORF g.89575 m.89575 type:complete len:211 (-) comp14861_c0_seq8:1705-2337(-)
MFVLGSRLQISITAQPHTPEFYKQVDILATAVSAQMPLDHFTKPGHLMRLPVGVRLTPLQHRSLIARMQSWDLSDNDAELVIKTLLEEGLATGFSFDSLRQLAKTIHIDEEFEQTQALSPAPRPSFPSVMTLAIGSVAIAGVLLETHWHHEYLRALIQEIVPGTLSSGSICVTRHPTTYRPPGMESLFHPLYHPDPSTCKIVLDDKAAKR